MSMWDWVKQKLLGIPPQRDVSRLDPDQESGSEKVDMSGGPLKPSHRRKALRDRRLLPKARAPVGKRPKQMSKTEAERLFSASQRTRNRHHRDLLADPEQLRRLGLPLWLTEEEVARALGLSLPQLWSYSVHRQKEAHPHYVAFAVPKARGGERIILAPKRRLKAVQRELITQLVEKLPVSPAAHGFRKSRGTLSNASCHLGHKVVVRFDLQDFFPSCHWARVRGLLLAYGYSYPVATTLSLLMTESERQPVETPDGLVYVPVRSRYCVQGAPTSPGLANALTLKLDRRLLGLAAKLGWNYTRYADDLTFSSQSVDGIRLLQKAVAGIVESEGFALNQAKTKIMRQGRRQTVTGVVVNQVAGLSRQERRRLRAALHQCDGKPDAQLRGKLAYLSGLNRQQAEQLLKAANPPE